MCFNQGGCSYFGQAVATCACSKSTVLESFQYVVSVPFLLCQTPVLLAV